MVPKKSKVSSSQSEDVSPASHKTHVDPEEARRVKKRELDRRCQRMARDRTKAHIAHLEKLVEDFRSQDSTGRISSLMKQLEFVKAERDQLAKTLSSIAKLTQPHHGDNIKDENLAEDEEGGSLQLTQTPAVPKGSMNAHHSSSSSSSTSPDDSTSYQAQNKASEPMTAQMPEVFSDLEFTTTQPSQFWANSMSHTGHVQPQNSQNFWEQAVPIIDSVCECSALPDPSNRNGSNNKWRLANDVLVQATTPASKSSIVRTSQDLDEEIPIRVVLEGWEAVQDKTAGNPAWQALRQIDERIFGACPGVERLAVLYFMNGLLRAHAETGSERLGRLPNWFRTKPQITNMAQPYAVNYFTWPGLRQRFVDAPHRYCSNDFWRLFTSGFRIKWPFQLQDCFSHNKFAKTYTLDPSFIERLHDLRSWTLGQEFFRRFPELYSVVPAGDSIPQQIWQQPPRQFVRRQRSVVEVEEDTIPVVPRTIVPVPTSVPATSMFIGMATPGGENGLGEMYNLSNVGFEYPNAIASNYSNNPYQ